MDTGKLSKGSSQCLRCQELEHSLVTCDQTAEAVQEAHSLMMQLATAIRFPKPLKPGTSPQALAVDLKQLQREQDTENLRLVIVGLNQKLKVLDLYQQTVADTRRRLAEGIAQREAVHNTIANTLAEQESLRQKLEQEVVKAQQEKSELAQQLQAQTELYRQKCQDEEAALVRNSQLQTQFEALQQELSGTLRLNEHVAELNQQIENAKVQREQLRQRFDQTIQEYSETLAAANDDMKAVAEENEFLNSELQVKAAEIDSLKQANDGLREDILARSNDIHALTNDLQAANDQAAKAAQMEALVAVQLEECLKLNAKIEENGRLYEAEVEKLSAEQQKLQQELKAVQPQLKKLERETHEAKAESEKAGVERQQAQDSLAAAEERLEVQEDSVNIIDQVQKVREHVDTFVQEFYKEMDFVTDFLVTQSEQNLTHQRMSKKLKELSVDKATELDILRTMMNDIQKYKLYQAVKDDPIDQALAEYIANRGKPLDVPFIREDEGIYLFGSKRIFLKLEGDKIIIRIGGGFMNIEQFVDVYTPLELERSESKRQPGAASPKKTGLGKLASGLATLRKTEDPNQVTKAIRESLGGSSKFASMLGMPRKPSTGQVAAAPVRRKK